MCLGIPGEVETVEVDEKGMLMGRISFGGVVKRACLDFVPEVSVGDYVLVHVGFALSCLNAEEARETLDLLRQMGEVVE